MKESNYDYLVSTMKRDIKTSKRLIEIFEADEKMAKEERARYGEGLNHGWVMALQDRVRSLEFQLKSIGEELENDTQRTSA